MKVADIGGKERGKQRERETIAKISPPTLPPTEVGGDRIGAGNRATLHIRNDSFLNVNLQFTHLA